MSRKSMLVKGILAGALAAGPVVAAINPLLPGLPQAWNMTTTRGYGQQDNLNNNPGSAMCVECHTVNPSTRISNPLQGGTYDVTNGATNLGTHVVMNNWVPANARGSSNTGGGFTGGYGTQPRVNGEYVLKTYWLPNGQANKGISKLNDGAAAALTTVLANGASLDWGAMDVVCESCHNILVNEGNQLLLDNFDHTAQDALCVRCHTNGGTTYAAFHANDNLASFNGNARKRHHVMNADTLGDIYYDPDGVNETNDSVMWAPSFSNKLDPDWCGTGKYSNQTDFTTYTSGVAVAFRGQCNVSGAGTYSTAVTTGDIGTTTNLRCTSCHRPHNSKTNAGAFILRTGAGGDFVGDAGTYATSEAKGIRRQIDAGSWLTTKIYGEYAPVCAGCHQGYE